MTVRAVRAHQWLCPACHETGLERTAAGAAASFNEHFAEYHD